VQAPSFLMMSPVVSMMIVWEGSVPMSPSVLLLLRFAVHLENQQSYLQKSQTDGHPTVDVLSVKTSQLGHLCGETDSICVNDACVGGKCTSSKLSDGEPCKTNNDCLRGVCAPEFFSNSSSPLCCASGASIEVYTSSSDGWPSRGPRDFCTDQPMRTPCGVTDLICLSKTCVGGKCDGS